MTTTLDPFAEPFGTIFSDHMTVATYENGSYSYSGQTQPLQPFSMHPGSHVLHYASTCFEGLKAHRQADGSVAIFRLDDHVARMQESIAKFHVETPDATLLKQLILDAATANAGDTPPNPGSLYIRPAFIGTLENIGAAASPTTSGLLYVVNSPVGDYFKGGIRPLSLLIETQQPRTTPQFGAVKSGANYAMALGPTLKAKADHGVDQVLFAAGDDVTETGAANFFLIDDTTVITRELDDSFLHGITRQSAVTLAKELGYDVQERKLPVDELISWQGEAFLSGTAAVLAPVGSIVLEGQKITFGDGQNGPNTLRLREALTNIQVGKAADTHSWMTKIR